jgi:hypothetical protein
MVAFIRPSRWDGQRSWRKEVVDDCPEAERRQPAGVEGEAGARRGHGDEEGERERRGG